MSSPPQTSANEILGLDNVPLNLPIAGIGSRTLAAILDYVALVVLMSLWWISGLVTVGFLDLGQGFFWAILILGSFLLQWGYFAVLEIVMHGQTPGKSAMHLRVVSYHGGRSSNGAILMRNLVRAVDLLVGLVVMAIDGRFRRLGDMVGGTLVIHQRPPSDDEEVRLARIPQSWGPREIVVVESFLRRAGRMELGRAQEMAEKLLVWIARQEGDFVSEAGETATIEGLEPGVDRVALLWRLLSAETSAVAAQPVPEPKGEGPDA